MRKSNWSSKIKNSAAPKSGGSSSGQQTKDKHPLKHTYVAKDSIQQTRRIDMGGGKSLTVEPGSILKTSDEYEGQLGNEVVLAQPYGSKDGNGFQGSSTFTMTPGEVKQFFKPATGNDKDLMHKAREARSDKSYVSQSGKPGRRGSIADYDKYSQRSDSDRSDSSGANSEKSIGRFAKMRQRQRQKIQDEVALRQGIEIILEIMRCNAHQQNTIFESIEHNQANQIVQVVDFLIEQGVDPRAGDASQRAYDMIRGFHQDMGLGVFAHPTDTGKFVLAPERFNTTRLNRQLTGLQKKNSRTSSPETQQKIKELENRIARLKTGFHAHVQNAPDIFVHDTLHGAHRARERLAKDAEQGSRALINIADPTTRSTSGVHVGTREWQNVTRQDIVGRPGLAQAREQGIEQFKKLQQEREKIHADTLQQSLNAGHKKEDAEKHADEAVKKHKSENPNPVAHYVVNPSATSLSQSPIKFFAHPEHAHQEAARVHSSLKHEHDIQPLEVPDVQASIPSSDKQRREQQQQAQKVYDDEFQSSLSAGHSIKKAQQRATAALTIHNQKRVPKIKINVGPTTSGVRKVVAQSSTKVPKKVRASLNPDDPESQLPSKHVSHVDAAIATGVQHFYGQKSPHPVIRKINAEIKKHQDSLEQIEDPVKKSFAQEQIKILRRQAQQLDPHAQQHLDAHYKNYLGRSKLDHPNQPWRKREVTTMTRGQFAHSDLYDPTAPLPDQTSRSAYNVPDYWTRGAREAGQQKRFREYAATAKKQKKEIGQQITTAATKSKQQKTQKQTGEQQAYDKAYAEAKAAGMSDAQATAKATRAQNQFKHSSKRPKSTTTGLNLPPEKLERAIRTAVKNSPRKKKTGAVSTKATPLPVKLDTKRRESTPGEMKPVGRVVKQPVNYGSQPELQQLPTRRAAAAASSITPESQNITQKMLYATTPLRQLAGTTRGTIGKATPIKKGTKKMNENYINHIVNKDVVNFTETIRNTLDAYAHQAIENEKYGDVQENQMNDDIQENFDVQQTEEQINEFFEYINSLDEDQLNEYIETLDEQQLAVFEQLIDSQE